MPRYYFNVEDGRTQADDEGTWLRDAADARTNAVRFSGEMLRDNASKFWDAGKWRLDVTDDRGRHLFALKFEVCELPAQSSVTKRTLIRA